jgi:hypothetical protein
MRRRIWIASATITLLLGVGLGESWGQTFTHQQSLMPSGGSGRHQIGLTVAISGDTAVVSAQDYHPYPCFNPFDSNCSGSLPGPGSAHVFVRSNGSWIHQQRLAASNGTIADTFGASLAISGERIVIGAPRMESAYVFERSGTVWTEQHTLKAKNAAPYDGFGTSVAISRETIVVGAPGADQRSLADAGSAYVFENSGGSWIQQQLVNQPPGAGDAFGCAVAIGEDLLVVGAHGDDAHGTTAVFTRSGGVWSWQGTLAAHDASAGDGFGASVAISGTTVVVGAPNDDEYSFADSGSIYVFAGRGAFWSQQQKIVNPYSAATDRFGYSVGISGSMLAVGTPNDELNGTRQGTAVVFESIAGVWREDQWFLFETGTPSPAFGHSVAISGGTVVVGAPGVGLLMGGSAQVFSTNTRPTIQAATVQSPPPLVVSRSVIATVGDQQDFQSAMTVTVNGAASATVNGVTVSAISIDAWGTVTADVVAISANAEASFVLRVTDTTGLFAEATLVVRNLMISGFQN